MKITIEKDGVTQDVKPKYLQNFLDRGWNEVKGKGNKPAAKKIEAAAEVKPVDGEPEPWDINSGEDWADSEESMSEEDKAK